MSVRYTPERLLLTILRRACASGRKVVTLSEIEAEVWKCIVEGKLYSPTIRPHDAINLGAIMAHIRLILELLEREGKVRVVDDHVEILKCSP